MGEFRCTVVWLRYRFGMKVVRRPLDCNRAKYPQESSDSLEKRYAELVRLRKEVDELEAAGSERSHKQDGRSDGAVTTDDA